MQISLGDALIALQAELKHLKQMRNSVAQNIRDGSDEEDKLDEIDDKITRLYIAYRTLTKQGVEKALQLVEGPMTWEQVLQHAKTTPPEKLLPSPFENITWYQLRQAVQGFNATDLEKEAVLEKNGCYFEFCGKP